MRLIDVGNREELADANRESIERFASRHDCLEKLKERKELTDNGNI